METVKHVESLAGLGLMGLLIAREDGVRYVTYGAAGGDTGSPVDIETAIDDVDGMGDDSAAGVVWYEWPERGQQQQQLQYQRVA